MRDSFRASCSASYVVQVGNLRRIGNPPLKNVFNSPRRRIANPPQEAILHYTAHQNTNRAPNCNARDRFACDVISPNPEFVAVVFGAVNVGWFSTL